MKRKEVVPREKEKVRKPGLIKERMKGHRG